MADVLTPKQRSSNMAAIRGKDTRPEIVVRRITHALGYRYVLHGRKLPGKPDLVFPSRRRVIFVHGCFWHMHSCRFGSVVPATHAEFWSEKRAGNVRRDERNIQALLDQGWKVLVLWECETRKPESLKSQILEFLGA
jgi:DNA mismatch endonuclease (patch repair protein)